jgi:hypothetical protein
LTTCSTLEPLLDVGLLLLEGLDELTHADHYSFDRKTPNVVRGGANVK